MGFPKKSAKKSAPAKSAATKTAASKGKPGKGPAWDEIAKKSEKVWDKSRKNAGSGGGGRIPDIADGVYTATPIKSKCGTFPEKMDKGEKLPAGLWATLTFAVTEGEAKGTNVQMSFRPNTPKQMDFMTEQLSRFGYDLSEFKLGDLPKFFDEVIKEKPSCEISVKNGEYNGKPQLNVYLNGLTEA